MSLSILARGGVEVATCCIIYFDARRFIAGSRSIVEIDGGPGRYDAATPEPLG